MLLAHSVLGNGQKLDGGAMFGNVPRALWSSWCPPDEQGRISLACRALLIDDGERKLLFEAGIGAFFEPKLRGRFGVEESEHVLLRSLEELGLSDADIDGVVLSHLHFDHAGGLLSAWSPSEPARLLFPNARFFVGKTAFERALKPHARDRASFIGELTRLLSESGRLVLCDGARDAEQKLGERYRFFESHGHTPGMLHSEVRGTAARLFFCADLVPGAPWVHLPVTMGYDRFPERLIDEKTELFTRLDRDGCYLFFTHDAATAAARVARSPDGKYTATEPVPDFTGWDLDARQNP